MDITLEKFEKWVATIEEANTAPPETNLNIPLSTAEARQIINEYQSIISQQREEIERVIAELEHEHKRQWDMERREPSRERQWYRQGGQDGLHFAINKLKEALANGTNNGSGVSKADEATQVQSEENNG